MDMDEALDESHEKYRPEEANNHPLSPAEEGYGQAHQQGRYPDDQANCDEHPPRSAVVSKMPGTDPAYELEGCESQIKSSKDHVQRRDDRELQESGVVRFPEVVRGGRRDADEYQGSDRHYE